MITLQLCCQQFFIFFSYLYSFFILFYFLWLLYIICNLAVKQKPFNLIEEEKVEDTAVRGQNARNYRQEIRKKIP